MKNLWQPETVQELKNRLAHLRPDSPRLWGKMTPAQAVAHCTIGMELALGDRRPPRMLIGRLLGFVIKPMAFKESEPMRRNSPTIPGFEVTDNRDLSVEREKLSGLIDRFAAAVLPVAQRIPTASSATSPPTSGPSGCTSTSITTSSNSALSKTPA